MRRLSKTQIQKIIKLRKQGFSLNRITNELNMKKSTVYYWLRKNFGRTIKTVKVDESNMDSVGEIMGAFAGDGSYYHNKLWGHVNRFHLGITEMSYARHLTKLINLVYNKRPFIMPNKKWGVIIVKITSKDVIRHIKKYLVWDITKKKVYTVHLKRDLSDYQLSFLRGFVRGLFDTDGWCDKEKKSIKVASVSKELITNINNILNLLKISNSIVKVNGKKGRKDIYYLRISKKSQMEFLRKIKLNNLEKFKEIMPPTGISGYTF